MREGGPKMCGRMVLSEWKGGRISLDTLEVGRPDMLFHNRWGVRRWP